MLNIYDLQYFQELHDRRYHQDIYQKPLLARIAHLHQHLVKYNSSPMKRSQTYPDAIACLLSMANALNMNITTGFGLVEKPFTTISDITQEWAIEVMPLKYQQALSRMAKLLEAGDHVEPLDYRNSLKNEVLQLFELVVQMAKCIDECTTLTTEYVLRISNLKKRHIFYARYHPQEMIEDPTYASVMKYVQVF